MRCPTLSGLGRGIDSGFQHLTKDLEMGHSGTLEGWACGATHMFYDRGRRARPEFQRSKAQHISWNKSDKGGGSKRLTGSSLGIYPRHPRADYYIP